MMFAGPMLVAQVVCVPDTQYTEIGLYPDSLPSGNVGQPYDQVVHVVVPQDTMVTVQPFGTIEVDICSITIDSIPNLPAGMTYECNGGTCVWEIDHTPGVTNRFCVKLSGTPTEAVLPDDSLIVYATASPGAYDTTSQTCDTLTINLPDSLTTLVYKAALKLETSATAIQANLNPLQLSVFPNPSGAEPATLTLTLPVADRVRMTVYSIRGEKMLVSEQGRLPSGTHAWLLPAAELPASLYIVEVQAGDLRQSQLWVRQ